MHVLEGPVCFVALRKESVDRNFVHVGDRQLATLSLSARRAWIEIRRERRRDMTTTVALRKESVDRNSTYPGSWLLVPGRSPQGERG